MRWDHPSHKQKRTACKRLEGGSSATLAHHQNRRDAGVKRRQINWERKYMAGTIARNGSTTGSFLLKKEERPNAPPNKEPKRHMKEGNMLRQRGATGTDPQTRAILDLLQCN